MLISLAVVWLKFYTTKWERLQKKKKFTEAVTIHKLLLPVYISN